MLDLSRADSVSNDASEEIDLEYAASTADRARELMSGLSIPPTPDNFGVWFQYVLGTDQEFNRTIDIVISNKRPFDKQINRSLSKAIRKLEGREGSASRIVTEQLHDVLGKATSFLAKAAADNQAHAEELGGVAAQVKNGCDPLSIIGDLTSELSRAALRASTLELQFAATSKELDKVRNSLRAAEHHANTDALTGLANRRALDEFLRAAQIRTMEVGEPLSIMLIDIDRFKTFNDNFGHQLGDHVLRLLAGVLKRIIKPTDLASRYGGEELVAVLPGADVWACRDVADRIRKTIGENRIVRRATGEALAKVTVSIGVAQYALGESVAELFERCDRALYLAKRMGRNCTFTEHDLDAEIAAEPLAACV